jgi:hypothetical protein
MAFMGMFRGWWSFWLVGLVLFSGVVLFDYLIVKQQVPVLEGQESISPLADYVEKLTRLGYDRKRLLPVIEDESEEPEKRLEAARELTEALDAENRFAEKAELLRYVVASLGDWVDVEKQVDWLVKFYNNPGELDKSLKTKAKKLLNSSSEGARNLKGLNWVLQQRLENLKKIHEDDPRKLAGAWLKLTRQALKLNLTDMVGLFLDDAAIAPESFGEPREYFAALGKVLVEASPDQLRVLLRHATEFFAAGMTTWANQPVPDEAFKVLHECYREAERGDNEALKTKCLALLEKCLQSQGKDASILALETAYGIFLAEGRPDRLREAETVLMPLLQSRVNQANPSAQDFDILRRIYQSRGMADQLRVLASQEEDSQIWQKRSAELKPKLTPVVKLLKAGKLAEAYAQYGKLAPSLFEADHKLPEVQALILALGMGLMGENEESAGRAFIERVPERIAREIPAYVGRGLVAQYCLLSFAKTREQKKPELARWIVQRGGWALEGSPSFQAWLEAELWFLDGARGQCPRLMYDVTYVPNPQVEIDGNLREEVYASLADVGPLTLCIDGKAAGNPATQGVSTQFRLFHDGKWLYLAGRAFEPDMAHSKVTLTKRDSNVWTEDCFEFFLHADHGLKAYQQWVFNRLGAVTDLNHDKLSFKTSPDGSLSGMSGSTDFSFESRVETAGSQGANGWTVEARIALEDIPSLGKPYAGQMLRANLRRFRFRQGKLTTQTWDSFGLLGGHSPEAFNFLRLQ